jgi:hypothetical protein
MKARSKIMVAAAVVAALAGTSGAALAVAGTPRIARTTISTLESGQGMINPFPAVQVESHSVRQGGILTVRVTAQEVTTTTTFNPSSPVVHYRCITDVRAWAYPWANSGVHMSTRIAGQLDTSRISLPASGKAVVFAIRMRIPKGTLTGTWFVTLVTGIACGTKADPWNAERDIFDNFTVLPK